MTVACVSIVRGSIRHRHGMLAGRCMVLVSEKVGGNMCFLIGLICPWVNYVRHSFAHHCVMTGRYDERTCVRPEPRVAKPRARPPYRLLTPVGPAQDFAKCFSKFAVAKKITNFDQNLPTEKIFAIFTGFTNEICQHLTIGFTNEICRHLTMLQKSCRRALQTSPTDDQYRR